MEATIVLVAAMLIMHEGVVLKPYRDTTGHITIGVGHNLKAKPVKIIKSTTITHALQLLQSDIMDTVCDLDDYLPWWRELCEIRAVVLVDMAFNMGIGGLLTFKSMLAAVRLGDYREASIQMLHSRWAKQVGHRARRLAHMMKTGEVPKEVLMDHGQVWRKSTISDETK